MAGSDLFVNDGIFHPDFTVRTVDVPDGTSNTIMIGERVPGPEGENGGWYAKWGVCSTCPIAQILAAGYRLKLPEFVVGCSANRDTFGPADRNVTCTLGRFGGFHPGGANFAFADGSVRFVRYSFAEVMPALATRAGNETDSRFE